MMSHIPIHFFTFLVLFGVVVQFINCTVQVLDRTHVPTSERILKRIDTRSGDITYRSGALKSAFGAVLDRNAAAVIAYGTKWCGHGNKAKNENDLGRWKDTDKCCRTHDQCKNYIEAGGSLLNLHNDGSYTRSACICDKKFHSCLKNVPGWGIIAGGVGNTYFNILRPKCFKCVKPTNNCDPETDDEACKGKCKKYGWFSNPWYWG